MRSLDEIFFNLQAKREILFEDGKWCIYRKVSDGPAGVREPRNRCYMIHRCDKVKKALDRDVWVCGNNKEHGCGEVAPKELQGLYILHGWNS